VAEVSQTRGRTAKGYSCMKRGGDSFQWGWNQFFEEKGKGCGNWVYSGGKEEAERLACGVEQKNYWVRCTRSDQSENSLHEKRRPVSKKNARVVRQNIKRAPGNKKKPKRHQALVIKAHLHKPGQKMRGQRGRRRRLRGN